MTYPYEIQTPHGLYPQDGHKLDRMILDDQLVVQIGHAKEHQYIIPELDYRQFIKDGKL
ncbi:hypothetical protein GCM10011332_11130 [Terasakiella brassicae]|uniref:Uncharacterized protein n=1 Tax=Terasakiella brassicae TaxID=1634917 RepID=A0A917BWF9_9PROT|nr:hypothetical protein [Terasakiella brassicae]GGF59279.1 hypothetical protein GCM10011332_11130 [Terasakiella brassicae]